MKILFLSGHYPPNAKGGGEISTHLIARGLIERGHEVVVITEAQKHEETTLDGVRVIRLPVSLTAKVLFEKQASWRIAKALGKDIETIISSYSHPGMQPREPWVVHAHDWRSTLVLYELLTYTSSHTRCVETGVCKQIIVVTTRDYAQLSGDTNYICADGSIPDQPGTIMAELRSPRIREATGFQKIGRATQYLLNVGYRRRAFQALPFQIFISHVQRNEILRHQNIPENRTAVIYNPVAPEYVATPVADTHSENILYAGRIEFYKGVGLLLKAWTSVARDFPRARLTLVGAGAQKAGYQEEVKKLGLSDRTTFVDHTAIENMLETYDQASIVVAPHLWIEPFGRTVVEGMARGRIVVAADAGGPAEIISHMKTGLLFERRSAVDLQNVLTTALTFPSDTRQVIGQAAREWVTKNLSIGVIAQQYENIYNKALVEV